jgi:chromosome segregation ATPase
MIYGLHQHIHFQQSCIAHVEQQSEQGMLACQQTVEFFRRENAAERWSSHQWSQEAVDLSTRARNLQKAVLTKIEGSQPSDEQTRRLMRRITKIESNILFKEIQNNDLKHALQEKRNRLEELRSTTTAMITARDDLNRKLTTANDKLRSKAGRSARTLSMVKREKRVWRTFSDPGRGREGRSLRRRSLSLFSER